MIDPPGMTDQTRISPKSFKFRFSLHMVKDDWPPRYDRPDQDLTYNSRQRQPAPKIFKLSFSLCMVKDDWPPRVWQTRPGSHLKVLSSDLVCTWSKMIDPPGMTDQTRISPKILDRDRLAPKIFSSSPTWSKIIDPPGMTDQTRISPKSFKFRFSLHMVKD